MNSNQWHLQLRTRTIQTHHYPTNSLALSQICINSSNGRPSRLINSRSSAISLTARNRLSNLVSDCPKVTLGLNLQKIHSENTAWSKSPISSCKTVWFVLDVSCFRCSGQSSLWGWCNQGIEFRFGRSTRIQKA